MLRDFLARFWQRPRLHGETIASREVSFLELFYDLVFVVVIARAAHHLAEDFHRALHIRVPKIERRKAEPDDVRLPEIADHATRDQRLHHRVGFGMAKTDLRTAPLGLPRRQDLE